MRRFWKAGLKSATFLVMNRQFAYKVWRMLWSSQSNQAYSHENTNQIHHQDLWFLCYLQHLPASLTGERTGDCRLKVKFPPITRVMDDLSKRLHCVLERSITVAPPETKPSQDQTLTGATDSSIVGCVHYGDDSEHRRRVEKHLQLNKRTGFQFVRKPVKPVPMKGRECRDGAELPVHRGRPEQKTRLDRQRWTASFQGRYGQSIVANVLFLWSDTEEGHAKR